MAIEKVPMHIARKMAGLSQKALGDMLGVAKSTIVSWEHGRTEPTIGQAKKIGEIVGIDYDDIIFLPSSTVKP